LNLRIAKISSVALMILIVASCRTIASDTMELERRLDQISKTHVRTHLGFISKEEAADIHEICSEGTLTDRPVTN
jgi:hypothetical protein